MFLSIIIPAYNESKRIIKTLDTLVEFFRHKKFKWEIIIVDDGSKDYTVKKVLEFTTVDHRVKLVKINENLGKGNAVKIGMMEATGEWCFLCDADLSMPIDNFEKFIPNDFNIPKYDIVIGSREATGSIRYDEPFYRHIYGKAFNFFVKIFMFSGINDTQCGFKLFTKRSAQIIFPNLLIKGFAFDVEVLFLAKKLDFSIHEIGIEWHHSSGSKVHVFNGFRAFIDVVNIRINYLKGKYSLIVK